VTTNNSDSSKLVPNYVEGDFTTTLNKFKGLLKTSDTFKDYNYHGSNMAMIIELLSYMSDMTNFYTNLVAKNVYLDTADVYETVHRLTTQKGYIPLGYLSSEATVSVTIENADIKVNDAIVIDAWQTINTGATNTGSDSIQYTLTYPVYEVAEYDGIITFDINLRQGIIDELVYNGYDVIDNQIILPFQDYDCGMYPFDVPAIQVIINDEEWLRVHDFYDHISGLYPEERNIYTFHYDKYKRYVISFVSSMNIPNLSDTIRVKLLKSLGVDGIIGSEIIKPSNYGVDSLTITNLTKSISINDSITEFTNYDASVGGASPETIVQLKANANANTHTQFRNVTSKDYKFHLEMRSDIVKGTAWGEQEVDPGNTIEYNKVYVSVIPRMGTETMFMEGTLNTVQVPWVDVNVPALSANIEVPVSYTGAFENNLLRYIEPRKMISVYEFPTIPDFVYFRFDIGIRVSRAFSVSDVAADVKNKLIYFFDSINREFREEINFMDIHNFIYDQSISEGDDDFLSIKGLTNFVIRDINTYTVSLTASPSGAQFVYEPNTDNNHPQYTQEAKEGFFENRLRPIQLGYNQFPLLSIDMCRLYDETTGARIL